MKKLVQKIDSHVESFDLEVTNNFDTVLQTDPLLPSESGAQHAEET